MLLVVIPKTEERWVLSSHDPLSIFRPTSTLAIATSGTEEHAASMISRLEAASLIGRRTHTGASNNFRKAQ